MERERIFIMKKYIGIVLILLTAISSIQTFAAEKAPEKPTEKKGKAELKIDKETLKKKVRVMPNGDTFVGFIPITKELCLNFPRVLDSYTAYLLPWVNIKEIDNILGSKLEGRNPVADPQTFLKIVNTAMGKYACRLKRIPTTEVIIKQRIQAGMPLYWFCWEDDNIWGYMSARTLERKAVKPEDWKKLLVQKPYKQNFNQLKVKNYSSFLVLGYNAKTGEIAISPANNDASIIWITAQEMKKQDTMLIEASW